MRPEDKERYSRQVLFAGIGETGQSKLLDGHVAIIGCGALGSFAAGALARAGVGRIRIVDRDYVELSNLQRQWLFDEADADRGTPKAIAAAAALARINRGVQVEPVVADLTAGNADEILGGVQLLIDGTDNFETRYLINDFAVLHRMPWVYGGAVSSYGISMAVEPGVTACLACLYPDPPGGAQETCETAGVLGPLTSLVASVQSSQALKLLVTGASTRRITTVDVWTGEIRQIQQPGPSDDCLACGRREFVHLSGARRTPVSLCGRNAVQIHDSARPLDLAGLRERLARVGDVRGNEFALRCDIPPFQLTVFPDGRAIIKGTTDIAIARGVYARYVGS